MEGGQSDLIKNPGFFGYVFNFDNENKGLMLNFFNILS